MEFIKKNYLCKEYKEGSIKEYEQKKKDKYVLRHTFLFV